MVPAHPPSQSPEDRKARLFCECGHSGPLPDWPVEERAGGADREAVVCPACGRVVVSQPVLAVPA
ncbi:MAG: hypothetical protein ABEI11_01980 [Haloarculaceae archaeon]